MKNPIIRNNELTPSQEKFITTIKWVSQWYYPSISTPEYFANFYVKKWAKWVRTRGVIWATQQNKSVRLAITRFLAGKPMKSSGSIAMNQKGIPRALGPLNFLLKQRTCESLGLLLTILNVSRTLADSWPQPDLSSITDPFKGIEGAIPETFYSDFVKDFCQPVNRRWNSFHFSAKSGPNGPATISSLQDLRGHSEKTIDDIRILAGESLQIIMDQWRSKEPVLNFFIDKMNKLIKKPRDTSWLRKLSLIKDKECKTRIIAIFDYWSQTALKPLNDSIFKILRGIKQDRTYKQGQLNLGKTSRKHSYHSIDLSTATDRFPLYVQKELLVALGLSREQSDAWGRILTGQKFILPRTDTEVSYNCGQPMGAYSSWSCFSLSHHLVVQYSAKMVNKYPFSNYLLLGDDIVISDDDVARQYKKLMSDLDVPISNQKSHVSLDTYEFAKRWVHRGMEITPFPVSSLIEAKSNYVDLYSTLYEWSRKGFKPKVCQNLWRPNFCDSIASFTTGLWKGSNLPNTISRNLQLMFLFPLDRNYDIQRIIQFLRITGNWISCNMRFDTLDNMFQGVSAQLKVELRNSQITQTTSNMTRYMMSLNMMTVDKSNPGVARQAYYFSRLVPLNGAMEQKIHDVGRMQTRMDWDVTDRSTNERILFDEPFETFPSLDQLDRSKKSVRLTGSHAWVVKTIARTWEIRARALTAGSRIKRR